MRRQKMATSESDDFESADEELNIRRNKNFQPKAPKTINSESDDDVENFSSSDHEIDKGPVPSQDNSTDEPDPVIKKGKSQISERLIVIDCDLFL